MTNEEALRKELADKYVSQFMSHGRLKEEVRAFIQVAGLVDFIARAEIFGELHRATAQAALKELIKAGMEPHEAEFLQAAIVFLQKCNEE